MRSLVVLSALFAACVAAPNYSVLLKSSPSLVSGPVYTEVQPAVSVVSPVYSVPAAVSHQSRVDVKSTPAVVKSYVSSPVVVKSVPTVISAPVSVVPATTNYVGGSAVSQQSRVDVKSYPAVVSQQVTQAVVAPTVVESVPSVAHAAYLTPVAQHVVVKSSPTVYTEQVGTPVITAHSVYPSVYTTW
ncbi:signaling mucin HKR1-like [Colias croceus]|uniref:signaling mucin HKR1-like n=1 Tax=Colias crocea TaxID=72248 RepID=UPI001E27B4BA|nr:signaling mucin HKR1-like [Colias croceus]